jgi:hypothetical protein
VGARRVVLHDRRARPSAVLAWRPDGTLDAASVRIPDHSWISIEPRAGVEAPWGAVDRLWHGAEPLVIGVDAMPLTVLTAVEWAYLATIPTVAEPARIPAGGGTAVLNLLATLAREQGVSRLAYAGPFPTEALFLALLECFRAEAGDDALACFTGGDLWWVPAPFTPSFDDAVYVQARERIEKVVWRGRAYYREDWGAVRRRAPLRVDDAADGVRCSLWALGAPLEDHLVLAPDGSLHAIVAPPAGDEPATALRPAIRDGVIAMIVAMSVPALADAIRDVSAALRFTCGPLEGELARVDGAEARVSATLAAAIARRLREPALDARAPLALAALAEIATAIGDTVRARAQARLAAATPEAQAEALGRHEADPAAARMITAAVAALLASGRVDDQPDVEGDERGDGDD